MLLVLIHAMRPPGPHSTHFFLSAMSMRFSSHIWKAGLALHSPLEFASKSSLSHPEGAAVWAQELSTCWRLFLGDATWRGDHLGKGSAEGSGGVPQPSLFLLHTPSPPPPSITSPTCSAFLWDCRWECRRRMRGTPFRACLFNSQ